MKLWLFVVLLFVMACRSSTGGVDSEPEEPDVGADAEVDSGETCDGCLVEGVCVEPGESPGDVACQVCSPEVDDEALSPVEDGSSCGEGRTCQAGSCRCEPGFSGASCDVYTRFVRADSEAAEPDGMTWETAFADLQDALALSAPTEGAYLEIWVAAGTYLPGPAGDRGASFFLG